MDRISSIEDFHGVKIWPYFSRLNDSRYGSKGQGCIYPDWSHRGNKLFCILMRDHATKTGIEQLFPASYRHIPSFNLKTCWQIVIHKIPGFPRNNVWTDFFRNYIIWLHLLSICCTYLSSERKVQALISGWPGYRWDLKPPILSNSNAEFWVLS